MNRTKCYKNNKRNKKITKILECFQVYHDCASKIEIQGCFHDLRFLWQLHNYGNIATSMLLPKFDVY